MKEGICKVNIYENILKTTVEIIDGVAGKKGKRGAGVIVDRNGYIFTNFHAVGDLEFIRPIVTLTNGEEVIGKVVYKDFKHNFAIVKVNRQFDYENVIRLGDSKDIQVGNLVVCVSHIRGIRDNNIGNGIVSNINNKELNINIKYNTQCEGFTDEIDSIVNLKKTFGISTDMESEGGGGIIFNKSGEFIGVSVGYLTYRDLNSKDKDIPAFSLIVPGNILIKKFRDYLIDQMSAYGEPLIY